jgi:hypothetical protein
LNIGKTFVLNFKFWKGLNFIWKNFKPARAHLLVAHVQFYRPGRYLARHTITKAAGHHRWASLPPATALLAAAVVLRRLIRIAWVLPTRNPHLLSPSRPHRLALHSLFRAMCHPWEESSVVAPGGAPPTSVAVEEESLLSATTVHRPPATPPLPQAPCWSMETPQPIHYSR